MEKVFFEEKQKFNQVWLWAILLFILSLVLYRCTIYGFFETQNIISLIVITLVVILFAFVKLETQITDKAIRYRYYPIQSQFREILWEDLAEAYVKEYRPILDFGGWGYRIGLFGKGKAISTSGNNGIQLYTKEHRKILIGTQFPKEVQKILENLGYGKRNDI